MDKQFKAIRYFQDKNLKMEPGDRHPSLMIQWTLKAYSLMDISGMARHQKSIAGD